MRQDHSKKMALCGLMAALAIVIMCLGGLIPFATYVCPILCVLIGNVIGRLCGRKLAWVWYAAVCILSILLAPDKESAILFVLLGCYPNLKPYFDRFKFRILLKLIYFNLVALGAYLMMLWLFGLTQILEEYALLGGVGILIFVLLANLTFFMLDNLLGRRFKIMK